MYSIEDRTRDYRWKAYYPELSQITGLPVRHMEDLTRMGDYRHAFVPADGTSAEELRDRLLKIRGITDYVSVGLPKPLATMIRTWTRAYQHEDLHASVAALEAALPSPYQKA